MKFKYYNDTGRKLSIHPATEMHVTKCDISVIKPLEERTYVFPIMHILG